MSPTQQTTRAEPGSEAPADKGGGAKPKRRWRLKLLIALAAVAALVWSAPYLLSTGAGTELLLGVANARLRGQVRVDDLSLRWRGPCRVTGLRLADPDGRDVVTVEAIEWGDGVWGAIWRPEDFNWITVDSPQVHLYLPEGEMPLAEAFERCSLLEALRPPGAAPPGKGPREMPELNGRLTVTGAGVRIVRGGTEPVNLTLSVSGTVHPHAGGTALDLSGQYSGSWESITALLVSLYPELAGEVAFTGAASGEFKVTGPPHRSGLKPGFKDLAAEGAVAWDSARIYSLTLGKAVLEPTLRDGVLVLPVTTMDAQGGTARVAATLDFRADEPTLTLPEALQALENVPVSRQLGSGLLSRINPVFFEPQRLTGRLSLLLDNLELPLGEDMKLRATARGRLALKDANIQSGAIGGQLLGNLLGLGGLTKTGLQPIRISDLVFEIKDGRVHYENLAMIFGGTLEMQFSGSVGLDDTLDLTVSLPVLPRQLESLVKLGSPDTIARRLGADELAGLLKQLPVLGKRGLDIHITGTRQKPRLDFRKVLPGLPGLPGLKGQGGAIDPLRSLLDGLSFFGSR